MPLGNETSLWVVLVVVRRLFRERDPLLRWEQGLLHLVVELGTLRGVLEHVVGVGVGDESLPRYGYGDLGHVDGDPASSPSLGLEGHGAGTAGEVENEVTWVGGHQEAALKDFGWGFNNVLLVLTPWCVRPKRVEHPAGYFVLIFFPA